MNRFFSRHRFKKIAAPIVFVVFFPAFSFAQTNQPNPVSIVVPEETIAASIGNLLPYEVPMGKLFSGALWVQSIDNVKIGNNSVTFSVKIQGKDIEFSTKIGDQELRLTFGEANVFSNVEASFRYDKEKKVLFIKPQIREFVDKDKSGQAGEVLMPLLEGLSGIEYPVELDRLDPVKTRLHNVMLQIKFDILDINSKDGKLFVEIIPAVEKIPPKSQ